MLQEALLTSAQVATDATAVQGALQELFKQPMIWEYDDMVVRQLIQKIVVLDEDRFTLKSKGI